MLALPLPGIRLLSADPLVELSLPYVSPPHIHCAGVLDQIKITGDDDKPLLLETPAQCIQTTPITKLRITEGPWQSTRRHHEASV